MARALLPISARYDRAEHVQRSWACGRLPLTHAHAARICAHSCIQVKWALHEAGRMVAKEEKIEADREARCLCVCKAYLTHPSPARIILRVVVRGQALTCCRKLEQGAGMGGNATAASSPRLLRGSTSGQCRSCETMLVGQRMKLEYSMCRCARNP